MLGIYLTQDFIHARQTFRQLSYSTSPRDLSSQKTQQSHLTTSEVLVYINYPCSDQSRPFSCSIVLTSFTSLRTFPSPFYSPSPSCPTLEPFPSGKTQAVNSPSENKKATSLSTHHPSALLHLSALVEKSLQRNLWCLQVLSSLTFNWPHSSQVLPIPLELLLSRSP